MDERREPLPAEGGRPDRPKHRGLRRFLIFLAVLAAVLGVVALAAWRDGTGFDALRRYFAYGAGSGSGTIRYEASTANRFAALDGGVAILSDRELTVCTDDGTEVCRLSLSLGSPALAECRGRAVAYDVGGTELYVVDISGEKFHLSLDGAITAASLNGGGYLAVTAEAPNCKSAVSVYDPSGTEIFLFKSAQRFLSTASVTVSRPVPASGVKRRRSKQPEAGTGRETVTEEVERNDRNPVAPGAAPAGNDRL